MLSGCSRQVCGVNDWDDDELIIGNSDAAAADLPLVLDKKDCPGLQVCALRALRSAACTSLSYL